MIPDLPPGATARIDRGRASVILDVTGLDAADVAAREAAVRAAAGAAGYAEVRIAHTRTRTERRLIAIASGKGGVGKSTLTANLAAALARRGRAVGLVDADISGPSQPRLLGVADARPAARDNRMVPVATPSGVALASMGMLVPQGQAVAWRGPMLSNALNQMMDAHWGAADPILIDLPPGTGDVQLSMIAKHRPAGAIIVSTPQDLALIDAARAADLFAKAGVPVIGVVENMAGYACPSCGHVSDPFGRGGAEGEAARIGVPFLGRIPLSLDIRQASDAGAPPAAGNGADGAAFEGVADALERWLDAPDGGPRDAADA